MAESPSSLLQQLYCETAWLRRPWRFKAKDECPQMMSGRLASACPGARSSRLSLTSGEALFVSGTELRSRFRRALVLSSRVLRSREDRVLAKGVAAAIYGAAMALAVALGALPIILWKRLRAKSHPHV